MILYLFGAVLIMAGIYHFVNPVFYDPFMPEWFPKPLANILAGIAEIGIGAMLLRPDLQTWGIWLALALMIIFLPLHVIDLLRERPVIGSKFIAVVRLLIQFVLIGWLWWLANP